MKAMSKDWRKRFESVQAFAEALEKASLPVNPKRQSLVGKQLGNYRLVKELGQGGFANVYLGEHIHLTSLAAIKVLDTRLTNEDQKKFINEARIVANLRHPHIVGVLNFGIEGNMPYLIMDYAPNGTIRQRHPKGTRLSLTTIMPYVKQAADALHYAHYEGLIHRDVKPENMLLGKKDEILLSDFGIAVAAYGNDSTTPQEILGTLPYMAPEQIQGKPTRASDQYSLSVVIYEWLCGTCPYIGTSREITIGHLGVPPKPLREHTPTIPQAIEDVVLKALSKNPLERYPTIQAFADAFEKACQAEGDFLIYNAPPLVLPAPASSSTENKLVDQHAETVSRTILPLAPSPIHIPRLQSPSTSEPGTPVHTHHSHTGTIYTIAWSPDGRYIASGGVDKVLQIWNPNSIKSYRNHTGGIHAVIWSPNGTHVASASSDHTIQVRNAKTGEITCVYREHAGPVFDIAWSPDGASIASASDDETVHIWNAATGKRIVSYTHSGRVNSVAWSPNGTRIASASIGNVQIWEPTLGRKVYSYREHGGEVYAVAWSPDNKLIASGGAEKVIHVWNPETGDTLQIYRGHASWMSFIGGGNINALSWLYQGFYRIASASDDKTVQVWNPMDGQKIFTYKGHNAKVKTVSWSPDEKYIASAGEDGLVQIWMAPQS